MPPLSSTEDFSYCSPLPPFKPSSPASTVGVKKVDGKQSSSASSASSRRKSKELSFAPSVTVRCVQHLDDFTNEQVEATWYTPDEFKMMKRDVHITVKMMSRNERLGIDQCVRGLEHKTREGRQRRMMNQIESISAVMDEQDLQRLDGTYDDERIARVYKSYTVHCAASAHFHGLSDQRVATGDIDYFHNADAPSSPDAAAPSADGQQQPQQHRQRRRLSCTAA